MILYKIAFILLMTSFMAFPRQLSSQTKADLMVTISEPGVYSLTQLYEAADTGALVEVVSGDTESYSTALYKARVLSGYKNATEEQVLFFGPYRGTHLGEQYLLFLKSAKELARPVALNKGYGIVSYSEVFDEGYSSMNLSYECVFSGPGINEQCDEVFRVCTDYIKLSLETPVAPSMTAEEQPPFGCRYVRKRDLLALLPAYHQSAQTPGR